MSGAFAGLSYGWWTHKHNRHHGGPNQEGKDPDIAPGMLAFTPALARARTGAARWFVRRQGWFFFPLLLLVEGVTCTPLGCARSPRVATSSIAGSRPGSSSPGSASTSRSCSSPCRPAGR